MSKTKNNGKGIGIKGKLIFTVIPVSIISIIALLSITFITTKKIILDYADQNIKAISNANANEIETWAQDILSSLQQMKNTVEQVEFTEDGLYAYIHSTLNINEAYPDGIYIGTGEGELITATDFVPPADYVVTDRDWYKKGLTRDSFAFDSPYIDANTGDLVITASVNIDDGSRVAKVLGADIFLNKVSTMVGDMKLLKSGTVFLINPSDNTLIAHKDSTLNGTKLDELQDNTLFASFLDQLNIGNKDVFQFENDGSTYRAYLEEISNTGWVLASYVPETEVLENFVKIQKIMVIAVCVTILLLGIVLERMIHRIIKPIKKLTGTIAKVTHGDFSINVEAKGSDEVGIMSKSMQVFIEKMRGIIGEVDTYSKKLREQAENSSKLSETLHSSALIQSSSMQELNNTVNELARSISEIAESTNTLAMVVSEADDLGQKASLKMQDTVWLSDKGRSDMMQVNEAMSHVADAIHSLETTVDEVGASTTQIDEIINLIGEIANETNLLSLNAAIEAARAGESGRGFAVVADEIRKLAETSSGAVQNIANLINNIRTHVDNTAKKTKESVVSLQNGTRLIEETSNTFNTIYTAVNESNHMVQDIIDKVKEVDQVATSVAAITEEQSASAQEILATSEGLLDHAQQVTSDSEVVGKDAMDLAVTAEHLDHLMDVFTV